MKHVHLNFYQRITLWNMIGNYQTPKLKEALVFLRILEKIRPGDVEMRETQFISDGAQLRWALPEANYGDRHLDLEDEEAKSLLQALESVEGVRVADAAWMFALVDSLRGSGVPASSDGVPV